MSKLEVDAIEPQSGTTLTLGASGDSVNIASGATITDFTSTGIDDNATSTAITIDSSENVGIGTTPSAWGSPFISGVTQFPKGSIACETEGIILFNNAYYDGTNYKYIANSGASSYTQSIGLHIFNVASSGTAGNTITFSEVMRIDSSGALLLNTTSSFDVAKLCIKYPSVNRGIAIECSNTTSASQQIVFKNPNGIVGSITTSGSSTAFNTSSDHRLKENVVDITGATERLKQLQPKRFNFIADANTTVDGFLAHEVQDIVPEAITGEKDATETKEKVVVNANGQVIAENIEQANWEAGKIADEEGNTQYPTDSTWEATKVVPVYQGIDQAKLVPLLVKTIQELEARITALENA